MDKQTSIQYVLTGRGWTALISLINDMTSTWDSHNYHNMSIMSAQIIHRHLCTEGTTVQILPYLGTDNGVIHPQLPYAVILGRGCKIKSFREFQTSKKCNQNNCQVCNDVQTSFQISEIVDLAYLYILETCYFSK